MRFAGIDEAALGPILGPFCAASVSLTGEPSSDLTPIEDKNTSLFFTDSKKIYSKSKGIEKLERNALALVVSACGVLPENLLALLECLGTGDRCPNAAPWYAGLENVSLPVKAEHAAVLETSRRLDDELDRRGLKNPEPGAILVPAADFNRSLADTGNKADVVRCYMALLAGRLKLSAGGAARIVFDCQGGRRYYDDWLSVVFPLFSFRAVPEREMLYRDGDVDVQFKIKADAGCLHVAMASMIAKYLREMIMRRFNGYWQNRIPSLPETAGYPEDGKRFVADLILAGIPENEISPYVREK